jgi:glycosyltransferase involved in cell wall biosynthesis
MREVLHANGWDARLFAETSDPALDAGSLRAGRNFAIEKSAAVIFHQGTQWDSGFQIFEKAPGLRIVRDHNVTPPEFFEGLSDDFVTAARVGLLQRERLATDPDVSLFLAASRMNADELIQLGADPDRVAVVPPFNRAEDLARMAPDEGSLRRWVTRPATALFVGRIAPNKGHRRMLRIAAAYAELYGERLYLRFVGPHDRRWAKWLGVLERDRARLGLDGSVEYLGVLSEAQLKAAYLTAPVFLCCSEHEGFCVPLVEAAHLGVPVVATYQPAVAETLGPDALVLRDASDDVVAAAVRRVVTDAELRDRLVSAQRERFARVFSTAANRQTFLSAVESVLANEQRMAG